MKEKFLQNLWKNKVFHPLLFRDTDGNPIEILDFGKLNSDAGPDFHSAKIKTQNLIFYGNIELHSKSSDWYLHGHSYQKEYQSIILHVVFEHDQDIPELKEENIPTIELKKYIDKNILQRSYLNEQSKFIPCEEIFSIKKIPPYFSQEIIIQKLEEKHLEISQILSNTKNDYEALLFQKIAYAFGLKVNADIFLQAVQNIGFGVIKKILHQPFLLESLLLGKTGLLNHEEAKPREKEFLFLKNKYHLDDIIFPAKYLRMMPISFPTIRLSQLAQLYAHHHNLFSKIIHAKNTKELKELFKNIKTSKYWEKHFVFGKESPLKIKTLSEDFIEIILLNAILPIIYAYHREQKDNQQRIISFYQEIKPEKNSIIKEWKKLGAELESSLDSQAFLYLYKKSCTQKKCLTCHQIQY